MAFFLDTQETAQRFGNSTAEFRRLLDTNHIRHGSPDDLFEFAKTLEDNNQFRMDLSALVKSVMKKEGDELLLTDMMSIVATAVGGESVAETHIDITRPTKTLMEFLLGTGCWRYFGSPSRSVAPSAEPPRRSSARTDDTSSIRISLPASPVAPVSTASASIEERSSLLEIAKELRQTLSRLEGNTQQVKLHLDSIENRINKIETEAEASDARVLSGLEPLLHRGTPETAPAVKTAPPLDENVPIFATRGAVAPARAVFSQPAEPAEDEDFTAPTFAYGTEKRRSIVPLAIFLVLVAIGVAAFLFLHFGRGATLLQGEISRFKADHASAGVPAAPVPATSTTQTSPSIPSATATSSPATPQPAASNNVAGSPPVPSTAPDTSSGPESPMAGSKYRYIPANVMEGYLLSAPRPQYPPQARADHVEGQVVLQATISKSGSIMSLHAIKGPPSLRDAAIDAVRTWRYRPYLADEQVQDVATTIYVDFTLKPPPVIVR